MEGKCRGTSIGLDVEGKQGDIKNVPQFLYIDVSQCITASSTAESLEVWASIYTVWNQSLAQEID